MQRIADWQRIVRDLIPQGAYEVVNLEEYKESIDEVYDELYPIPEPSERSYDYEGRRSNKLDANRLNAIAKDTFLSSVFLPCHHDFEKLQTSSGNKAEVIISHPQMSHVDVLCVSHVPKQPNRKHLSLNTMGVSFKQVKKVKEIRLFVRSKSVFADWREDSQK